jgi:hypothetical protein
MNNKCFNYNVDKLELKYLVNNAELFNSSIDDLLRSEREEYKHNNFTFKRRTQRNLKNKAKDKYLYYRQVFSVLYKSEYVFEIYFDPYNTKLIKDSYLRVRVLNSALYLQSFTTILKDLEQSFSLIYQGYTQIDIALDVSYNIQDHLKRYFRNTEDYSINYNRRPLDYIETFGKEYRNGNKDLTIYLRHKVDNTKQDTVIYNKTKEVADKGKDFFLRIINKISNGTDVYRIEIQLNERSKHNFDRFSLTDKVYLEDIYNKQFNKMLDIRLLEKTRTGNLKKRSRCEKIDFITEIKAEAKKNASVNE